MEQVKSKVFMVDNLIANTGSTQALGTTNSIKKFDATALSIMN